MGPWTNTLENFDRAADSVVWGRTCHEPDPAARSLRNVLHFLVGIGEMCNDKLGTPCKKCNKLFYDARDDCMELLSAFNFLCHIVDGFRPLCGLARATIAAFEKMEFEFNISASMHFDMNVNTSQ
ncbi:DC-STAMP domain-containing protein 2-like [Salvelinus alpinus]